MISVITPIYDVEKHLGDYAENMRRLQNEFSGIKDIILINNNIRKKISKNKVLDVLKNLKIIENKKNIGYGRACNQGMRIAEGEYVLILNPDIKIDGDSLKKLLSELMKNKKVNIASCKLLDEDGSLQHSCRRFPSLGALLAKRIPFPFRYLFKKELDRYDMADYDHKSPRKVDWVSGALMLMRKRYLFDENYFMYFEDIDLCRKVKEVYYYPTVSAVHRAERGSTKDIMLLLSHVRSTIHYFWKHYRF